MSDQQHATTHLLIWTGNAIFTVAVVVILTALLIGNRVEYPAGTAVTATPVQRDYVLPLATWHLNEYQIRPVAEFKIEALVLSTRRYRFTSDSQLSEVDLALGWGPMSNDAVLRELDVWQSGRWYHYRWSAQPPIAPRDISLHSTNLHTVPANDEVRRQLREVRAGEIVYLEGFLVNISREDGWHWNSSTSRSDTGNGACELMWVERVLRRS